jgi:hypothetical protein
MRIALDEPFPVLLGHVCTARPISIFSYMERGRRCSALIAFFLVAINTDPAHAEIHIDDFASVERLSLVGDASVSDKVMRLTPARRNQAAAVW